MVLCVDINVPMVLCVVSLCMYVVTRMSTKTTILSLFEGSLLDLCTVLKSVDLRFSRQWLYYYMLCRPRIDFISRLTIYIFLVSQSKKRLKMRNLFRNYGVGRYVSQLKSVKI